MNLALHPVKSLGCLLGALALSACQSTNLPTHDWQDPARALQIMRQRYAGIDTLKAPGRLTLENREGDRVSLESLVIMDKPNRLRAQAWKFGRKVLDLTVMPSGVWLWFEQRDQPATDARPTDSASPRLLFRALTMPKAEDLQVIDETPSDSQVTFVWLTNRKSGRQLRMRVHRPTLTPRRIWLAKPGSDENNRDNDELRRGLTHGLTLADYRMFQGVALPTRLSLHGEKPLTLELGEIQLNVDLPAGAFDPPSRAERFD